MCNGQAASRTTYSKLFSVIGTTYGSGNGSTTFNVPDRRGRVGVGLDTNHTYANSLGKTNSYNAKDAVVVSHNHETASWDNKYVASSLASDGWYSRPSFNMSYGDTHDLPIMYTSNVGESGVDKNLQPYIVQNYIIRAK